MDKIVIEGGKALRGSIRISGSKNSALPLLAATLLTKERVTLDNVPDLADIRTMEQLIKNFGGQVSKLLSKRHYTADRLKHQEAPYDLVRTMRASILVLGPLLARFGKARVSLPGGCAIGARPINLHLKALEAMGAKIHLEGGYVEASCAHLRGASIVFDTVTVTGTENIMMAACLARGKTTLHNAAREPEIVDLAELLQKMGARIRGAGTDVIEIEGVESLHGTTHTVIPDRIEAGTFMIAAAMTRGDVTLTHVNSKHLESLTEKLRQCGVRVEEYPTEIRVMGSKKIEAVDLVTAPYPGFATDFQAQFVALMTIADGTSTITETIFENRFMHIPELARMGADLKVQGNTVIVKGVSKLTAAPIMASDLRASACLVLAGLVAKGITEIHRVYHIDRGYQSIEKKLRKVGAKVKRVKVKY